MSLGSFDCTNTVAAGPNAGVSVPGAGVEWRYGSRRETSLPVAAPRPFVLTSCDSLKRLFERYLGVPPAEAGQGTAWRFEWELPWAGWLPNWLACLVIVALVGGIVWVYTRDARRSAFGRRVGLVALRLLALVLVAVFLTRLRLSVERTGLPTVVVLIDDSASMQIEDRYEAKDADAVKKTLREAGLDQPARLRVKRFLPASEFRPGKMCEQRQHR